MFFRKKYITIKNSYFWDNLDIKEYISLSYEFVKICNEENNILIIVDIDFFKLLHNKNEILYILSSYYFNKKILIKNITLHITYTNESYIMHDKKKIEYGQTRKTIDLYNTLCLENNIMYSPSDDVNKLKKIIYKISYDKDIIYETSKIFNIDKEKILTKLRPKSHKYDWSNIYSIEYIEDNT